MARRIPLPRLTRRQRLARWQRERRQQAVIVVAFSAVLFFVVGLVAWAASDKYYQENLKPAVRFDGRAHAMREWKREVKYAQTRFYVEFGVPPGFENDSQIAQQKASYERTSLDALVEDAILDAAAREDGVVITRDQIASRYQASSAAATSSSRSTRTPPTKRSSRRTPWPRRSRSATSSGRTPTTRRSGTSSPKTAPMIRVPRTRVVSSAGLGKVSS